MSRVYNFSAGPAVLPEEVLEQAAAEMMDYRGCGQSVMVSVFGSVMPTVSVRSFWSESRAGRPAKAAASCVSKTFAGSAPV